MDDAISYIFRAQKQLVRNQALFEERLSSIERASGQNRRGSRSRSPVATQTWSRHAPRHAQGEQHQQQQQLPEVRQQEFVGRLREHLQQRAMDPRPDAQQQPTIEMLPPPPVPPLIDLTTEGTNQHPNNKLAEDNLATVVAIAESLMDPATQPSEEVDQPPVVVDQPHEEVAQPPEEVAQNMCGPDRSRRVVGIITPTPELVQLYPDGTKPLDEDNFVRCGELANGYRPREGGVRALVFGGVANGAPEIALLARRAARGSTCLCCHDQLANVKNSLCRHQIICQECFVANQYHSKGMFRCPICKTLPPRWLIFMPRWGGQSTSN